ncbi:ribonuclease E inhibitor RraB [Glaciecola sp. MH2013]|uniref:ribonuclease E inhibitor RraB n=1 Tax=Glaciecola sp. MH2013 TaxID=2785524 RepID=UPI0018A07539|nr:ribonuclease E inhibitor RraB [Glaciecola sp. MH2013]MBF7074574.1 ribonuclease E inhibitor RraB [Glaciecola sp. MH2013]
MFNFPDDEDGNVLKILAERGLDMTAPIEIEFAIFAKDESAAKAIANEMERVGLNAEIDFDEGDLDDGEAPTEDNREFWPCWSIYHVVTIVPSYQEIVSIQKRLDVAAKPYGGYSDGWNVQI